MAAVVVGVDEFAHHATRPAELTTLRQNPLQLDPLQLGPLQLDRAGSAASGPAASSKVHSKLLGRGGPKPIAHSFLHQHLSSEQSSLERLQSPGCRRQCANFTMGMCGGMGRVSLLFSSGRTTKPHPTSMRRDPCCCSWLGANCLGTIVRLQRLRLAAGQNCAIQVPDRSLEQLIPVLFDKNRRGVGCGGGIYFDLVLFTFLAFYSY